jgi:hypothetical protein
MLMLYILGTFGFSESHSNVFGRVVDEETNKGIPGIWVLITNVIGPDGKYSAVTDDKGDFEILNVPVFKDWKYELDVSVNPNPDNIQESDYFSQIYYTAFYLQKGKNLYLETFKIKRGISIQGNVKLWDGTPVTNGRIDIELVTSKSYDPYDHGWNAKLLNNGSFVSEPVPFDEDLEIVARYLSISQKKESYGRVIKKIRINKGDTPGDVDIIIPEINTEIKGRILDANNVPLDNQSVKLTSHKYLVGAGTDENGYFTLKHLEPGDVSVRVEYRKNGMFVRSYRSGNFDLNLGDSIWLDITVDGNIFNYKISRKSY